MRFSRKSCCQREASSIAKALIKWNSLPVTLMNSAQPADSKNAMEYLSSLQHGAETFQNSRKDPTIFLKISKTCINFMAWFRGVVYHLPWHMIHNIKPTDHGSYHVKGFWDCPMYSWNRWVLEMSTWVETPCSLTSFAIRAIVGLWSVGTAVQLLLQFQGLCRIRALLGSYNA